MTKTLLTLKGKNSGLKTLEGYIQCSCKDMTLYFSLIFNDRSFTEGHSTGFGEEDFRVLVS